MRARAAEKASASGAGNVEKAQPSLERGSGFETKHSNRLPFVVISLAFVGLGLWAFLALRLHDLHGLDGTTPAPQTPAAPKAPPVLRPKDESHRRRDRFKNRQAQAAQAAQTQAQKNASAPAVVVQTPGPRTYPRPSPHPASAATPTKSPAPRAVALPMALIPRPQVLEVLQLESDVSKPLEWSLHWVGAELPLLGSDARFALNSLESLLHVTAKAGRGTSGLKVVVRPGDRTGARHACLELLKQELPRSHKGYEEHVKDCHATDWHFALFTPSGLCVSSTEAAGIFRFASTLGQMMHQGVTAFASDLPHFILEDWPRFCWRGLQLDAVRHFMPVSFVKRYIEEMAAYKANFFHWHLTDDQSWRLFLRSRPKLVKSSMASPESYSEDDVQQVLSFAREHFVTVIPVIETPGHILAALAAYPELACKGKHFEVPKQRVGTYTDILCVGKATTFEFAKDVFTDVARLFPSRWIHVGGDEVIVEKWWMSDHVRAFAGMAGLRNIPVDMMEVWFCAVGRILKELGRQPIMWDDHFSQRLTATKLCPNAHKDWVVQAWKMDYPVGNTTAVAEDFPFASISSPMKSVYLDYPVASIDFNRSTQLLPLTGPRILGGCATMWTEDSEPKDVFTKVFPRFMAISERLWGGLLHDPRRLDLSLWWAAHRHCERFAATAGDATSFRSVTCGRFEVKTGARSPMFARARISTSLDNFGDAFQVGQAFDDDPETYFWAVSPQAGDMIEVAFLEGRRRKASLGKWLKELVVKTGSKDRPSDQLEQGQLKVAQWLQAEGTWALKWRSICAFKDGECRGDADTLMKGPIVTIRLTVMATQTKWMALPEFEVEEAQEHPEHPTAEEIEDTAPGSKSHLSQLVSNVWESLAGSDTVGDAAAPVGDAPESTTSPPERRRMPRHALRPPPHNMTRRAPRNVTRRPQPRLNETTTGLF